MKSYDIVVVGGGPSGITLAKRLGKKFSMAVIRPEPHSMIYCAMPYAVEKLLSHEKTLKKDTLVTDSGATLIRDMVNKIDLTGQTVTTENGEIISWNRLIIATGADPVIPPIPGADRDCVCSFKRESDLGRIIKYVDRGLKHAAVVGAGAIGIELAQALNSRGVDTHLFDMANHVLPSLVDHDMASEAEAALIQSGISLHMKSRISALSGEPVIHSVHLENGRTVAFADPDNCSMSTGDEPASIVIFAVGMKARTTLLKNTAVKSDRDGIVVNGRMETNIANVYAVGDCTSFTSGITGERTPGKLATNAVPMAKVLASNLLGEKREYPGFFNGAATKAGKWYVGGTGLSEETSSGTKVTGHATLTTAFPIMENAEPVRMKLIADGVDGKVLGGQVVSRIPVTDKIDQITIAVQSGKTLRDLRDFSYSSQPWQSFFPANNLIVASAEDALSRMRDSAAEQEK